MPTYEYVCDKCEYEFERFQSMTEAPVKTCPKCKSKKVRRLLGIGAGIIFKGSGFYETDYKRKESPKSDSTDTSKSDTAKESKSADSTGGGESKSKSKKAGKQEAAA